MKKLARKLWTGRSSREVQQSLFRRRPLFEALERRYLMSAELLVPPPPPASDQAPIVAPANPGAAAAGAPGQQPPAPGPRGGVPGRPPHRAPPRHPTECVPLLRPLRLLLPLQVQRAALQSPPFPIPRRMGIQSTRTGIVPE
ncbi:hypothetical protein G6F57_014477 [Rhizopus arrhizus]|nr:hypothetical protein G6F57_014477 [Rhizopus arrhizus]